jgi:hypothetical protein
MGFGVYRDCRVLGEVMNLLERLDAADGPWVPACNQLEKPFITRTGHKVLYMYHPNSGRHAYFDLEADLEIHNEWLKGYGLA